MINNNNQIPKLITVRSDILQCNLSAKLYPSYRYRVDLFQGTFKTYALTNVIISGWCFINLNQYYKDNFFVDLNQLFADLKQEHIFVGYSSGFYPKITSAFVILIDYTMDLSIPQSRVIVDEYYSEPELNKLKQI